MSGSFKPLFGTPLKRDHWAARDLAACWLLNENTGRYVWDATGNGNDGTCTNMADPPTATSGWGPGPHGGALAFDGSNDFVNVGHGSTLSDLQSLTYSIWVNPAALSSATPPRLFGKRSVGVAGWNDFGVLSTGALFFGVDYATQDLSLTSVKTISLSQWSHVAVTWDGGATSTGVNFYINGSLSSGTGGANGTGGRVSDAAQDLAIGNWASADRQWNGLLDSPMIYNRALSTEEVAYLNAFPFCMFEEEGFPAWMIPPFVEDIVYPQTVYGAARGVPILHGRGMRKHSESSRRPGQLSTTRRAG